MAERYTRTEITVDLLARTTTGVSGAIDVSGVGEVSAFLNVTAVSGTTPTLDVKVQVSPDNVTWHDEGTAFAQITAAGAPAVKKLSAFGRYIRYSWVIAGTTPSFTFSIQTVLKY